MEGLYDTCCECGRLCTPEDVENWLDFGVVPVVCDCGAIYWVRVIVESANPTVLFGIEIPELPVGSNIEISNKEHQLFGKQGKIIEKKPLFYRVLFDNRKIWIPENWVKLCMA